MNKENEGNDVEDGEVNSEEDERENKKETK